MKSAILSSELWLESVSGERFPFDGHCSIGRSRTNTIPLTCEKISRRHMLLHRDEEGQCLVIDLGSSNGTFVNGSRIEHVTPVFPGDCIEVGSHRFFLRTGSAGSAGTRSTAVSGEVGGAELVSCWMLIGDKEATELADRESSDGDSFKTIVHWTQAARRLAERHGGGIAEGEEDMLFAYWADPDRSPAVVSQVAACLRDLQALQARQRPCQFRLALHLSTLVIGSAGARGRRPLIGTEVSFALLMRKLAWVFSRSCLISEEANRALSKVLPTTALEPCSLRGYEGSHRFFGL